MAKRYIIENRTEKLLRTDKITSAEKKITQLREARTEPWFKFSDTQDGHNATYELHMNNYRKTLGKTKP